MQIVTEKRDVHMGGQMAKKNFTVEAGAHIMAILSGLYKNPIDALVREYLTNMYDAYIPLIKAGKNITPPIIRLPSTLSNVLEFEDFGIGMDYDTVWNVYSQYGSSTKTSTNDEVGGFGIGSKTAFCYNDGAAWNITATKDGKRHFFMAFVGEDGIPQLSHVGTEQTDKPNGVNVSIPILRKDIIACVEAAMKYIPFFPIDISVENLPEGYKVPPKPEYEFSFGGPNSVVEKWGMRHQPNRGSGGVKVIMGNVPYNATNEGLHSLSSTAGDHSFHFSTMSGYELHIYVPIGAVDIVPSRDALKFTDKTTSYLSRVLKVIHSVELPQEFSKKLDDSKTLWDAMVVYKNNQKLVGNNKNVKYRGNTIGDALLLSRSDLAKNLKIKEDDIFCYVVPSTYQGTPKLHDGIAGVTIRVPEPRSNYYSNTEIAGKMTTPIIINDTDGPVRGLAQGYIRHTFNNTSASTNRLYKYGHTPSTTYVIDAKVSADDVSALFGGMDKKYIHYASTLKKTVKPLKEVDTKSNVYRWDGNRWAARAKVPTDSKKYYYVPLKKNWSGRYTWTSVGSTSMKDSGRTLISAVNTAGITLPETSAGNVIIYGIREDDISSLDKKWINLIDAIKDSFTKIIEKHSADLKTLNLNKDSYENGAVKFLREYVTTGLSAGIISSGDLLKWHEDVKKLENLIANAGNVTSTILLSCNKLGIKIDMDSILKSIPNVELNLINRAKKFLSKNSNLNLTFHIYTGMNSRTDYYYGRTDLKTFIKHVFKAVPAAGLDNQVLTI